MKYSTEKIVEEMEEYFGDDTRRIEHALSVLNYARQIHEVEGGDKDIIEAAAVLHDIGIPESEKKYNSASGNYQEQEGPPIANEILKKYDMNHDDIFHVCRIIANHHSDRDIDSLEFKIIWDADWIVNIPDERNVNDVEKLDKEINSIFKTETGKEIAKNKFL